MYKVLLVDDEELELIGIQKLIPWGELDMEVASACNDAFTALDYLQNHKVDVLVSDIKMPIMSGLELASKALRFSPDLKIVFVSGYEDFQYAKQAISMNASGYVLKPDHDNELTAALSGVRDSLKQEQGQFQLEQSLQQSMVYLKNELLGRCLEGAGDQGTVLALIEQFGLGRYTGSLCVAVAEVDDMNWRIASYSEEERKCLSEKIFNTLFQKCHEAGINKYCKLYPQRLAIVLDDQDELKLLEDMITCIGESYPLTLTIGLGGYVGKLDQLQLSYNQACKALSAKMFQGKGKIICFSPARESVHENAFNIDSTVDTLFAAMSNYELVQIVDCMEELFLHVKNIDSQAAIHNYSLYIISKLDVYLTALNENLFSILRRDRHVIEMLFKFETIDDIHSWLRKIIFEISELFHNKKLRKNIKLIREIESYIVERLHKNITLKEVANAFSFSPNYLGYLFKEETDENFSDYITRKRMDIAKNLLKDTSLKVYEVADRIGCGSLAHFSKLFKDNTGMTPGDYRKRS
ncbi:two-component system response regulator YesN [Paenibacillus castaneae]|uniref:response regulator n=1 Tax=Paenibacillus castaneae TaxID=474957 RepID=UPI00141B5DB3|nr:response regulator [Paenibacillus castaneae]NIK77855.1 two-component system response regulator YesN [Paenibacillus castaneae]